MTYANPIRSWILPAIFVGAGLAAAACSGARPPQSGPPAGLFDWAMERYEGQDFGAAVEGFRAFVSRNPVHPKADSAQYMLAESMLRNGNGVQAGQEFRQMALTRPGSPLADDAQLGACRAYWESSPGIENGQEHTRTAIDECQRLSEFFPESDLVPRAEEIIREAREKLARKQYRLARYYFDDGFYESANIYLETVLQQYPDASIVPDVLATYYRSLTALGFEAEARQVRQRLLSEFPDSRAAAELGGPRAESGAGAGSDSAPADGGGPPGAEPDARPRGG